MLTHEAGHQIQHRASGNFANGEYGFFCPTGTTPGSPQCPGNLSQYTIGGVVDPPWVADTCGCGHVRAANQEHCLQSVERSGAAQLEGFAQFYASRSWNQDTGDCSFTYYKEFLDATCRNPNAKPGDCKPYRTRDGRDLISTLPPAAVSCRQPARWRNKQECSIVSGSSGMAGDYGTEYDWMGFLYNINRPVDAAGTRVPTNDIWLIYRHACTQAEAPLGSPPKATPDMCQARPFVWDATNTTRTPEGMGASLRKVAGFRQGVEAQYASSLATVVAVTTQANLFGVGSDTTPLP
ncbi:MAG TPA: hypothetical protein VHB79_05960 [Polyangiaceae bacterium]|nr:hypothetical protein [Polyangiaceae bacterium]